MAKNQEVPSKPLPVVLRNAGSAPYNTAEKQLDVCATKNDNTEPLKQTQTEMFLCC